MVDVKLYAELQSRTGAASATSKPVALQHLPTEPY
jgi:hypothetical protein